jgi:hypothetical protein
LIEQLAPGGVRIFVLHDFDKSGLSISATLHRDTTRYQFERPPEIVDLGLRLADVELYALESEPVVYPPNNDPRDNLEANGASEEEIQFLAGERHGDGRFHGRRVELNAFTSDGLVEWLEAKLGAHRVSKVIPDVRTLEQSYRRALELHEMEQVLKRAVPGVQRAARAQKPPANLSKQIAKVLKQDPARAWDEALYRLTKKED